MAVIAEFIEMNCILGTSLGTYNKYKEVSVICKHTIFKAQTIFLEYQDKNLANFGLVKILHYISDARIF